jgi:hypothetical protein
MRFSRAPWLLLLSLGLWSGACAPEPAVVPERNMPVPTGSGGTAPVAGTSNGTAGTGSPTAGSGQGGSGPGAGGTGNAGSASTSGGTAAVLCGQAKGAAADLLIDDLEDGDNTIGNGLNDPDPPVRVGYWFTYNEKTNNAASTCMQMPPPDPQGLLPFPPTPTPGNGSALGARTAGSSCTVVWGAGMGFDFNNCNKKSNVYDASAYQGIQFWYKSTQPIRALVAGYPNTAAGGCTADCDNHHGKNFIASASGTTATITWAELSGTAQIGSPAADPQAYGTKRPFDPTKLLGFQVQVDQAGGASFEIWLDDLTFL